MTGEQDQPGILPHVMDVLFNTITEVQAPKYVRYMHLYNTVLTQTLSHINAAFNEVLTHF